MRLIHDGPALLLLALLCAACAPYAAQGQRTPTVTAPSGRATEASPAAPPVATPTRTPLRPTRTPTPPATFTEKFDGQPPHWVFLSAGNSQAAASPSIRDGFLVFDLTAVNEWGYALYGSQGYGDALIEAQVQSRTPGDGAAGLVCNYDEARGWYEFNIFADQTYELLFGQWLAPGVARYTPLYQGTSPAISADTNQMGLGCQQNQLSPTVNGAALRKWSEQKFALTKGQVGLSASSFAEVPFTLAFDWVRVSQP